MKVTNISNGPRGLHTSEGLIFVDPGKSVEFEPAKGEEPNPEWFGDGKAAAAGTEVATAEEIVEAISLIDAKNDDHWTAGKAPAVDPIADITGKKVTRAAIKAAAPDAKRPE